MMLKLIALSPALLLMAGIVLYGRKAGYRRSTIFLLLAAIGLCYFYFYTSSWISFALDGQYHLDYSEFLLKHHRAPRPEDAVGGAARHPPAYYILSAIALQAAQSLGLDDPIQFSRHVSVYCYTVFLLLGVELLRLILTEGSMAFIASLLIFFFWPIGIVISGRISCDSLLYMGDIGVIYGLVKWHADRVPAELWRPFFWSGVAILGKNSGMLTLMMAVAALLVTAYDNRRNVKLLLRTDLIVSVLFGALCMKTTFAHGWIIYHINRYNYYPDYLQHVLRTFTLDQFLYANNYGIMVPPFWSIWLHSLLFGMPTLHWKFESMLAGFKCLWLIILLYGAVGLFMYRRWLSDKEKAAFFWIGSFAAMVIASQWYMLICTSNPNYSDARYAFPCVIGLALMQGCAIKYHLQAGHKAIYRNGIILSVLFAGISILIFTEQVIAV